MGQSRKVAQEVEKIKRSISSYKSELQSALSRLKSTYTQFEIAQGNLEQLEDDVTWNYLEFEDLYGSVESEILNLIAQYNPKKPNENSKREHSSVAYSESRVPLKIPEIPLPKFDGLEEKWTKFRGIYNDLFHSNTQLSDIAKFHYLITCVRDGKAYQFVQPFPISAENYQNAYQNLIDYYDNEVKIQKIHMKHLYEIKRPMENSAPSLQTFLDTVTKHYNSLRSLKASVEHWNLFLSHHLCERLDDSSRSEIISKSDLTKILEFEQFVGILQTRVRILEAKKGLVVAPPKPQPFNKPFDRKPIRVHFEQNLSCSFCKGNHTLDTCPKFTDRSIKPQQRFNFVKRLGVCVSCFDQSHKPADCKNVCCSQKHNTLLHFGKDNKNKSITSTIAIQNINSQSVKNSESQPLASSGRIETDSINQNEINTQNLMSSQLNVGSNSINDNVIGSSQVLLSTVVLWVRNVKGVKVPCRALLDSGSQANFITEKMSSMLGLKVERTNVKISGINNDVTTVNKKSIICVESQNSEYKAITECLVKNKISGLIPHYPVKIDMQRIPSHVQLADPWFFKPDTIDILLGAELFLQIMKPEKVDVMYDIPLQNSEFGYIVMGRVPNKPKLNYSNMQLSYHISFEEINDQLQKFWQIEHISSPNKLSLEEKLCEEHYVQNVQRNKNGRYIVSLPTKKNLESLGESSVNALRQFYSLENRLKTKSDIRLQYTQFMNEYLDLTHMTEVSDSDNSQVLETKSYFMPHHSVVRESSSTTKLRLVFNASAKSSTGLSLNDCLMTGPTIQQDLVSIILRFRKHLIGITGDITKMYRQILIRKDQQHLQTIWWRETQNVEPKRYNLRTVTYGTVSAPFLAIRTLFQLDSDEEKDFAMACRVLKNDFYVDDVLTGSDCYKSASKLKSDLIQLLSRGGFDLRKITSNDQSLRSADQLQSKPILILGINWDTEQDLFCLTFKKYSLTGPCSKRAVLSEIAQLFDPLGFCGPIIFFAKRFMQTLWALKLDWDDDLKDSYCQLIKYQFRDV